MVDSKNYVDKDIKQVGYRVTNKDVFQDLFITKNNDNNFLLEYLHVYGDKCAHNSLKMTRSDLKEFIKNIQEQLLDNKWEPRK